MRRGGGRSQQKRGDGEEEGKWKMAREKVSLQFCHDSSDTRLILTLSTRRRDSYIREAKTASS